MTLPLPGQRMTMRPVLRQPRITMPIAGISRTIRIDSNGPVPVLT